MRPPGALARQGSVASRRTAAGTLVFSVRYVAVEAGRRKQKSIYLGAEPDLARRAAELIRERREWAREAEGAARLAAASTSWCVACAGPRPDRELPRAGAAGAGGRGGGPVRGREQRPSCAACSTRHRVGDTRGVLSGAKAPVWGRFVEQGMGRNGEKVAAVDLSDRPGLHSSSVPEGVVKRIATHSKPDADAIAAAWLAGDVPVPRRGGRGGVRPPPRAPGSPARPPTASSTSPASTTRSGSSSTTSPRPSPTGTRPAPPGSSGSTSWRSAGPSVTSKPSCGSSTRGTRARPAGRHRSWPGAGRRGSTSNSSRPGGGAAATSSSTRR